MTDEQISQRLRELVQTEKRVTREIVSLIQAAYERKIHLQKYANVFQWLTQEYGYSEGAANRRIQVARILEVAPAAVAKIESGYKDWAEKLKASCERICSQAEASSSSSSAAVSSFDDFPAQNV